MDDPTILPAGCNRIKGYDAYKLWNAAKLHYSKDDYSVVRYNWKCNFVSEEEFRRMKGRFLFERLAREYQYEHVFKAALGSFLYYAPKGWMRDMIRPNVAVERSLKYVLNDMHNHFAFEYGKWREKVATGWDVYNLIYRDEISPETAAIMYDFFDNDEKFRKQFSHHSRLDRVRLIPKYSEFIGYDRGKVAHIVSTYA